MCQFQQVRPIKARREKRKKKKKRKEKKRGKKKERWYGMKFGVVEPTG